jgi:DNA repair photolyase
MNWYPEKSDSLRAAYSEYLAVAGDAAFIDISRCTDPARTDQPWKSFDFLIQNFGTPPVVQIWTKGPREVLSRGRALLTFLREQKTTILCQLTVTGLGPEIEPDVPWQVDWDGIEKLIVFLGTPEAVLWRYDPVFPGLSDISELRNLAANFASRGVNKAVYNQAEYGLELVGRRMGAQVARIDSAVDANVFSREIEAAGRDYGVSFTTLAEGEKLDRTLSLSSRGCWQYEWLARVGHGFPSRDFLPGAKRPGCMCAHSFDVGRPGQFAACHRCVYCFAP